MAAVEFHQVSKEFGATRAVREFSLRLEDGELMVLLGPSGCGKSTVMRLLAGLEEPTRGDLLIDGVRVNNQSPQQRNVAMVFQNYALYPHMTVRKNLEFPLRRRNISPSTIRERVENTARLLDLVPLLEQRPRTLSGGQRQRVAMGRALVRDPSVFLMDEPLSNLDAKLRAQIRSQIADLQQRLATTTLYVTHDQTEAMTLGHRVAVMRGGSLQQVGVPQGLYEQPANVFVAGFLGNPPMNVLAAPIGEDGASVQLGETPVPVGQLPISRGLVGLRPESFVWAEQRPDLPQLSLEVKLVEALGHEQVLYLTAPVPLIDTDAGPDQYLPADQAQLTARLPMDHSPRAGERVALAIDPGQLHWFDEYGQAVASRGTEIARYYNEKYEFLD